MPDVSEAGFYYLSWIGTRPGRVLVPANLTSAAESDLSARELQISGAASAQKPGDLQDAHTTWTWLLAALALLLVAADAWWLTRKPKPRKVTRGDPVRPLRPQREEAA